MIRPRQHGFYSKPNTRSVAGLWSDLIREINDDADVQDALAITDGLEESDDAPALDEGGKEWDDALDVFGHDELNPLIDYASEHGYKWASQLQAGYRYEFLCVARENMVRDYVSTIIKGF